ncbi:hypothetical protein CR513_08478, partial [Mucuna pruriens]
MSDNGSQFASRSTVEFCEGLNIKQLFTSVEHPQSNGQEEAANKVILKGLWKRLEEAKGRWAEELPQVLWSYHTTPHSTTNETPFRLTFGTEAVILVENGEPSVWTALFKSAENEDELKANLDMLQEIREAARIREYTIKARVAKKYNERDLVLRKITQKAESNKLTPIWEGPLRVMEEVGQGAYRLESLGGKKFRVHGTRPPYECIIGQPFNLEIDQAVIPPYFLELVVDPFDGTQDPNIHLQAFQTQVYISGRSDTISCKLFLGTLRGMGESLKKYLTRFNSATIQVNDPNQKFVVKAFQKGLRVWQFSDSLALRCSSSMGEIRTMAKKHIEADRIHAKKGHIDIWEQRQPLLPENLPPLRGKDGRFTASVHPPESRTSANPPRGLPHIIIGHPIANRSKDGVVAR